MDQENQGVQDQQEDIEILQARLDAARQRKADAEALDLQSKRAAIAAHEAAQLRKVAEQKRLIEEAEQRAIKRKADAEAAERSERAQVEAERVRLEREFNQREEENRQQAAHRAKLEQMAATAHQLEIEAQQLEQRAIAQRVVAPAPGTPGEVDATSGRSLLFSRMIKPSVRQDGIDGWQEEPQQ